MGIVKKKKPLRIFLLQAAIVTFVIVVAGHYLINRFQFGFGGQKRACLPWDVYLIDKAKQEIKVGDLVAFVADERMAPKFNAGTTVIKQVAGSAGDSVFVDPAAHYIVAGKNYGIIVPEGAKVAQKKFADLFIDEIIPDGHMAVIGTLPRSFDSRYWGFISQKQIIGKAYGIY